MKNACLLFILCLLLSCGNDTHENTATNEIPFYAPEAGTVIAADSMRIEDPLNVLYFSAKIIATETSDFGNYVLDIKYGHNTAKSDITYPELSQKVTPAIQQENEYAYNIGFYLGEDKTFNEYARVSTIKSGSSEREIKFTYVKAYYVDSIETK